MHFDLSSCWSSLELLRSIIPFKRQKRSSRYWDFEERWSRIMYSRFWMIQISKSTHVLLIHEMYLFSGLWFSPKKYFSPQIWQITTWFWNFGSVCVRRKNQQKILIIYSYDFEQKNGQFLTTWLVSYWEIFD